MKCLRLTLVILAVGLVTRALSGESAQLSPDQAGILDEVRAQSLEYTSRLPDFICTQRTYRETTGFNRLGAAISEDRLLSTDVMEEKLTYFHHQESYEVVAINLKKVTGVQHTEVAGAISTGEFGSLLHDIFNPDTHTTFSWDKMDKVRGRRAYRFAFQVPRTAGIHVSDKISKQEISASYRGLIYVDAKTRQVLRITTHIDLPPKFAMRLAERAVDYRPVDIGGKVYELPFHSEVRMQDTSYTYLNKIDFKDYQKFAVEATLKYGNGSTAPGPPEFPANATIAGGADQTAAQAATPASFAAQPLSAPQIQLPTTPAGTAEPTPAQQIPVSKASPPSAPASQPASPTTPVQSTIPSAAVDGPVPASERSALDTTYRLQVKVNTVLVPVVARDAHDHAVGNLVKDDFLLFDRNKQQEINSFTIESPKVSGLEPTASATSIASNERRAANNYIVYLFDDLHLEFADLVRVRDAAGRNMDTLLPTDRAAIFTTSGRLMLDFTIDRAQLHDALLKLHPRLDNGPSVHECPDISFYMADQILNKNRSSSDPAALPENPPLQAEVNEAMACLGLSPHMPGSVQVALDVSLSTARRVFDTGGQASRNALLDLREVVRMITLAPGRKTIILVSPGFGLDSGLLFDETSVVDQAIRAGVVISTLDARGLYVIDAAGAIQNPSADANTTRTKAGFERDAALSNSGVLQELAAATGGTFIHNTNDLDSGFRRLTTPPEYTYLLGFTPEKLKSDGSFHALKVKLEKKENLSVQARSGYYAPKK